MQKTVLLILPAAARMCLKSLLTVRTGNYIAGQLAGFCHSPAFDEGEVQKILLITWLRKAGKISPENGIRMIIAAGMHMQLFSKNLSKTCGKADGFR